MNAIKYSTSSAVDHRKQRHLLWVSRASGSLSVTTVEKRRDDVETAIGFLSYEKSYFLPGPLRVQPAHNRIERALQLASHTSSPAQRRWSCQGCPAPMHHMARLYAGSPNMKDERESGPHRHSGLSTTLLSLYTRCLRARHIEIVTHSRKTPSSLRAPPGCRGESVCVKIARKQVFIGSSRDLCIYSCQKTRPRAHMPWRRT